MRRRARWVLGLLLLGAMAVATSCGGRAHVDGTDSNTHWLRECERDEQCGTLSCICGICSSECDERRSCSAFGADARCEVPAGCDARGATACVRRVSAAGGSASGGSSSTAGSGGGSSLDCAAMDARSNGDGCVRTVGYAWNGTNCQAIECGCTGADCEGIFLSADECDHEYRRCYESRKISRSCSTHGDCMLQSRMCCPPCVLTDAATFGDVLIATSASSPSLRDAGNCLGPEPQGGCGTCAPAEPFTAYAACIEGECRLLDTTEDAACSEPEDCYLRTRDCCECGGDFSETGLIAVSTFALHPYCQPAQGCPECAAGEPSDRAQATCDSERGLCRVGFIPK